MSDLVAELRSKWEEAFASGTSGREWRALTLAVASPVKLLAGIRDRDGRISVLIETATKHAPRNRIRFQAEGISLYDERCAEEGLLRLALTLERADLREIFEVLAVDLVSVAAGAPSPDFAIQYTIRRLEAWQACLRARRRGLSREEQAGLLGELAVMEFLIADIGFVRAISAWSGPLDGIHDFEAAGVALEVKATIGLSHRLHISRLDQMESEGLGALILMRAKFQEAPEGLTLSETIGNLRIRVERDSPAAVAEFSDKLLRTGYLDADAEIYGAVRIVLNDLRGFLVREGFPRLTAATVPPGVVEAAYAINERLLAPFRVSDEELHGLLRRMGGA